MRVNQIFVDRIYSLIYIIIWISQLLSFEQPIIFLNFFKSVFTKEFCSNSLFLLYLKLIIFVVKNNKDLYDYLLKEINDLYYNEKLNKHTNEESELRLHF